MHIRFHAVIAAAIAITTLGACGDDPISLDSLPRGAFAGVNTRLLSTMITHTTSLVSDSATGIVVAADIGKSRLSGDAAPDRNYRGLALFEVNGLAASVGELTANNIPLPYRADLPPAHYVHDTTAAVMYANGRVVDWRTRWTNGDSIVGRSTLPPSFGTITLSTGRNVSIAALDAGDSLTITWSGVVPEKRVFIYASWQPEVFAPTLVSQPIPVLIVSDAGRITLPGFQLSRMIQRTNGRLTFVLYRGTYETIARFDNGSRSLAAFSYVADSVHVNLLP